MAKQPARKPPLSLPRKAAAPAAPAAGETLTVAKLRKELASYKEILRRAKLDARRKVKRSREVVIALAELVDLADLPRELQSKVRREVGACHATRDAMRERRAQKEGKSGE